MKRVLIFLVVIGLSASLGAQSLAELAKREKVRRESFRGRHAVIIKNQNLLQIKKVPAVEVTILDAVAGDDLQAADQGAAATEASDDAGLATPPSGSEAASRPAPAGENVSGEITEAGGPLEDQLKAADQLVDQLATEMNALLRQYEAQNAMVPGSVIQQQIEETNQRLVQAQARQAKIREKMGKKGLALKKDP